MIFQKIRKIYSILLLFLIINIVFIKVSEAFQPLVTKIQGFDLVKYYYPYGRNIAISRNEIVSIYNVEYLVEATMLDPFLWSLVGKNKIERKIPLEKSKVTHFEETSFLYQPNYFAFQENRKKRKHAYSLKKEYTTPFGEVKICLSEKVYEPQGGLFFLDYINIFPGETVIDIGTGTGILAIAAAKAGGKVSATDISSDIIELAEYNADLNNIFIRTSVGSYFGDFFGEKFDVIIANLPQEIIPQEFTKSLGDLSLTLDSGNKGNEILLPFLDILPSQMKKNSRAYVGVYTLTNHIETLQKISSNFNAKLLAVRIEGTKDFVKENENFYKSLNKTGNLYIFQRDNEWKALAYLFELTKKV